MLSVTENAAEMISALTHRADLASGGLRIAQQGTAPGLTMAVVREPGAQDVVVLQHRVAVFLDPVAADRLASDTLDARSTDAGAAFFLEP